MKRGVKLISAPVPQVNRFGDVVSAVESAWVGVDDQPVVAKLARKFYSQTACIFAKLTMLQFEPVGISSPIP